MKKLLTITGIVLLLLSCAQKESPSKIHINKETEIAHAQSAIKAFAGELKAELKKAIKKGGPVNAIGVCNTKAISITRNVSKEQGLTLGRVSLKNRNPNNASNDWQKKILEDFEIRKSRGDALPSLTHAEIIEQDTGKQFRFIKAIPTGQVCLLCHGTNIAPDVQKKLDELYPEDRARGFSIGDIRGAFVVTKDFGNVKEKH